MSFAMWAGAALAAGVTPIEEGQDMVGIVRQYEVGGKETLLEVAWDYGLGYNEIADANPGIDPWVPKQGQRVLLPTRWALPDAPRKGILVNLAELRIYFFRQLNGRNVLSTYPIGVGMEGLETPAGLYRIDMKLKDPLWIVPPSIRKEIPTLPRVMPPGDENPLGKFAMRLGGTQYLIHGTNNPFGIGRQVSHGCIRLYPEDIRELFALTRVGAEVRIIYQPVKVAVRGGHVYVEVHSDYLGRVESLQGQAYEILRKRGLMDRVDERLLRNAIKDALGYPVKVSPEPMPYIKADKEQESG
ncbi:hypothetical protein LCGC14_1555170 [marine sediment metagenome]|uniref:Uncharacterized protein n=1 Tax=marine sediment metagenome TaxID=412755 RepID=A0A0F9IP56_9ZZZZ